MTVLHALYNSIKTLEIFPYEVADSRVLGDCLVRTIVLYITHSRTSNRNIVDVGYGCVGYLALQNICDVVMEYRNRIRPTHWKSNQAKRSEGCLKRGVISRGFIDGALVVAYVEIEDAATCTACEVFGELFCERRNTGMLYRDGVEWFETMNDAKRGSSLLEDCKPPRAIRRVRTFVDTGVDLRLNDFAHLVVYAWRNGHVAKDPRLVFDNGHYYGREEVFAESPSFGVIPCEAHILYTHEMMH